MSKRTPQEIYDYETKRSEEYLNKLNNIIDGHKNEDMIKHLFEWYGKAKSIKSKAYQDMWRPYNTPPCLYWTWEDMYHNLKNIVDLGDCDDGMKEYLEEILEEFLGEYENMIIQYINQLMSVYIEDELVKIKKNINELR